MSVPPEATQQNEPTPETPPTESETIARTRRGRLAPPWYVWLSVAGLILAMVVIRWKTITGDHAWVNVLTFLLGASVLATLTLWFAFLSGYSRRTRAATCMGAVGALALLGAIFRVEEISGELIPTFRPRWEMRSDERLDRVSLQPSTAVDMKTTAADDFPQFLGPHRNLHVDHVKLGRDWITSPPKRLWQQPIGAGWSAFSVVNGYAVTMEQRGSEEFVSCYEVASGRPVWTHSTWTRHETVPGGIGPRGTPTISGGLVYSLGAAGELLCLDGGTGSVVWRDNLLTRYGVKEDVKGVAWGRSASPLVVDDLLVVPAGGPHDGRRVSLAAFHKDTGKLAWESGDQQVSYGSPILTTLCGVRQIVSVNEKNVSGHDPKTGRQLWETSWPGNSVLDANVSQPVPVGKDRLLLTKGYAGGAQLMCVAKADPDVWSVCSPWHERSLLRTKFSNVVVIGDYAYGLSDGIMECVDLANGKRVWKKGRYGHGQILGVGDVILVLAESGYVILIEATPIGLHELAGFPALDGRTWNNLCLTGHRLLVRNAEEAACYELP